MKIVFKELIFSVMCLTVVTFCVQCGTNSEETNSEEYVDLGLPSGTKWKTMNETNPNDEHDFYTYDEAVEKFGDKLPTKEQFQELIDNCTLSLDYAIYGHSVIGGYPVVGKNGNSIFLPAAGIRSCDGNVFYDGSCGFYWSSTPISDNFARYMFFNSHYMSVHGEYSIRCSGLSVRLVQN